jgi:hypothetical protein
MEGEEITKSHQDLGTKQLPWATAFFDTFADSLS